MEKWRSIASYIIVGALTTFVNIASYWIFARVVKMSVMPSTICAWIVAVLFAYVNNRKWVFHSNAKTSSEICKEVITFFMCRLATGLFDWGCMFVFVALIHINDVVIKTFANISVIVLNYVASKWIVFKNNSKTYIKS